MVKLLKAEAGSKISTKIDNKERGILEKVLKQNPFIKQGLANDRPLYNLIQKLRKKGLVVRKGYRYFATKWGYWAFVSTKTKAQMNLTGVIM